MMLVDPLQMQTPTDWMILQGEMPRIPKPQTPGLTGPQATNDWLTPLKAAVRLLIVFGETSRAVIAVPLLAAVSWIQGRLTLYDKLSLSLKGKAVHRFSGVLLLFTQRDKAVGY